MFEVDWKHQIGVFGRLFKLQLFYWSENLMNLFLGLCVSLYTMVCWLAFKSNDPFLMISGICVGLVRNAMYIHLKTLGDFKAHSVYARYDQTPASRVTRTLATMSFNIFSVIVICGFMFIIAIIFFPEQRTFLVHSNQGMIWAGIILCWMLSYVMAYWLITFVKDRNIGQMIGLLLYFSTMYFLGLGFPFKTIVDIHWLRDVLYVHPFSYTMNIVQAGFANMPSFHGWLPFIDNQGVIHTFSQSMSSLTPPVGYPTGAGTSAEGYIDFGYAGQNFLPYLIAFLMFAVYGASAYYKVFFSLQFHKRDKYGKYIVNKSSSRYVHHLKDAKSIEEIQLLHSQHIQQLAGENEQMRQIVTQVQREMRVEDWFRRREKAKKAKAKQEKENQ